MTQPFVAATAGEALGGLLRNGRLPEVSAELQADEELTAALAQLAALYRFSLALSQGALDEGLPYKGSMAGALKALQASLRHLTWQTQRVAAGDFSQRVEFMGEFSDAFNSMVAALDEARAELARRNEELGELAARLEELATTDQLTGVCNRRKFDEIVGVEFRRAERYRQPLSLVIMDLDHFKQVNDLHGHHAGDLVLTGVAQTVVAMVRSSDCVARWGGEEFIVLAPGVGLAQAAALAERIRSAVAARSFPPAGRVTLSLGVAERHEDDAPESLLSRADEALYRAKASGRDRVERGG